MSVQQQLKRFGGFSASESGYCPNNLETKDFFPQGCEAQRSTGGLPFVTPLVSQSSLEGSERLETVPSQSLLCFLFLGNYCQKILEFVVASVKVLERVSALEPKKRRASNCKIFGHT